MNETKSGKETWLKNRSLFMASWLFLGAVVFCGCNSGGFTPSVASNPATNSALPVPPESSLTTNIAFTGVTTNSDNSFAFVVLQTLTPSDTLYFTDKSWDNTLVPPGFSSNSPMSFSPSKTLPPGTQVLYTEPLSGTSCSASIIVNSALTGATCGTFTNTFGMKKFDWECIAYQVSGGVTQFLTAINENTASPWLTSGPVSKGISYLPPGLNYQNSIDLYSLQAESLVYDDCADVQFPNEISSTSLLALLVYKNNWIAGPSGGSTALPGTGVTMCDFTAIILPSPSVVAGLFKWGQDLGLTADL
jgi:hypothetical protein